MVEILQVCEYSMSFVRVAWIHSHLPETSAVDQPGMKKISFIDAY